VLMCAVFNVMVFVQVGETKRSGKCSVVMCAAVTVRVWYTVRETDGNERVQW
jgi:hypothetical protein